MLDFVMPCMIILYEVAHNVLLFHCPDPPAPPFFNVNSTARKHSWMGQVSKPGQAVRVNREGRDNCLEKDRQQTEKEG
jgi:hypothetical protein